METNFTEYLRQQKKIHPSMKTQDAVKMCYQAAFGAEHLLVDKNKAYHYLEKEYALIECDEEKTEPLYEKICDKTCRVNLREWKRRNLPLKWLFYMFAESAVYVEKESRSLFCRYLESVREIFGSSKELEEAFLLQEPIHHSEAYREAEKPAYRLICTRYIRLLSVLVAVAGLPKGQVHTIAIEGRCASGKTTMASMLAGILEAGVVHMDDFFLPLELRTEKRFREPGGNVHYERVRDEVLPHLRGTEDFSYQRFDCSQMQLGDKVMVKGSSIYIVEGAYSTHPALGDYASLKFFSDVERKEQLRRIEHRDGKEAVDIFLRRWIPLEEAYFSTILDNFTFFL